MIQVYPHNNSKYFSCYEMYLALGKNHVNFRRWVKEVVINNPVLLKDSDYVLVDFKKNTSGRKRIHVLLTKETAISICVMSRTVLGNKLRKHIEEA